MRRAKKKLSLVLVALGAKSGDPRILGVVPRRVEEVEHYRHLRPDFLQVWVLVMFVSLWVVWWVFYFYWKPSVEYCHCNVIFFVNSKWMYLLCVSLFVEKERMTEKNQIQHIQQ